MLIRRDGNISHLFISLATKRSMGDCLINITNPVFAAGSVDFINISEYFVNMANVVRKM